MQATQRVRTARGLISASDLIVGDQVYGFDGATQTADTITEIQVQSEPTTSIKIEDTLYVSDDEDVYWEVQNLASQVLQMYPMTDVGYGTADSTAYDTGFAQATVDYSGFDYSSKCALLTGWMDSTGSFQVPAGGTMPYAHSSFQGPSDLIIELIGGTVSTTSYTIGATTHTFTVTDRLNMADNIASIIDTYTNIHGGLPFSVPTSPIEVVGIFDWYPTTRTNYRLRLASSAYFLLDNGLPVKSL